MSPLGLININRMRNIKSNTGKNPVQTFWLVVVIVGKKKRITQT